MTTTVETLNHPELLSAFWELKFNCDPTTVDSNGDDIGDWSIPGGGSFSVGNLINLTWQASGTELDSQPGNNFTNLTVVDVRFAPSPPVAGAGFNINAVRNGSNCAPVLAQISLQSDGTGCRPSGES